MTHPGYGAKSDVEQEVSASAPGLSFGYDEWEHYYPEAVSGMQRQDAPPFPDEELLRLPCPFMPGRSIGETHFSFLGLERWGTTPLTIERWWRLIPSAFDDRTLEEYAFFRKEAWATGRTCAFRWYLFAPPGISEAVGVGRPGDLPAGYAVPGAIEALTWLMLRRCLGSLPAEAEGGIQTRDACARLPEVYAVLRLNRRRCVALEHWSEANVRKRPGTIFVRKFPP